MNGVARLRVRAVQKHIEALGVPMNETGFGHRRDCRRQIGSAQKNVNVLRVAHRRFVHARNPRGDGVSARQRVRHARRFEGGNCPA